MSRYLPFLIVSFFFVLACGPNDDLITDSGAKLEFSLDTLTFDTVFTARGSATRLFKVYNTHNDPIRISKIMVAGGSSSRFRINVDGIAGNAIEDVEIAANDSMYVFGEVTVDPDEPISQSPFVINDEIIFETNGNTQTVTLEAWGQNAIYIPNRFSADSLSLLTCSGGEVTWDAELPIVLFGAIFIDNCILNINPGARIYVHGGLARLPDDNGGEPIVYNDGLLFILENGRLNIRGTVEDPVIIQGDRLEEDFAEVPGQWAGIRLSAGSSGHVIEHAIIKNSIVGLRADSTDVTLRNVQFANTAGSGLLGLHSEITAENCLFYNNGGNCAQLQYGGDYDFKYCTLASYGVDAPALSLNNLLCLDQFCNEYLWNDLNVEFTNSIIFGSRKDEISLAAVPEAAFDYKFQNCIVRVDELDDFDPFMNFFDNCNTCINQTSTEVMLFADIDEDDYHLDTLSIAEGQATPLPGITIDLEANERDNDSPDIGCYEYQYQ